MIGNKGVRIKQFQLIWTVLFMLFFRPAAYIVGSSINRILNYLVCFIGIMLAFFALYLSKKGYTIRQPIRVALLLYFWCLIGATFVNYLIGNSVNFSAAIVAFGTVLAFVLLCDIGIWYSPKKTLQAFLIVGVIVCSINAITFFLYFGKGGMNHGSLIEYGRRLSQNYFFLAEDNATYFWTWPVLVVLWLYFYMYNSKKPMLIISLAFTALVSASYLYVWSAMAMVACLSVPFVLFVFIRSLNKEKKGKRIKKYRGIQFWYMWVTGLLFEALLSLGVILSYFQPIIQQVFHKRATLTERTLIWERSYYYIPQSPIFGYGIEPDELTTMKILVNHTHNLFVETLYRGGIIGIGLLIVLFISLSFISKRAGNSIIYKFLYIMVFFFLIYSSVYFAFTRYHYLILFILMSHYELFSDTSQNNLFIMRKN